MRCILIFTCLYFSWVSFANGELLDRLVATVNSKIILQSDISEFKRTLKLRTQLDPLFSEMDISKKIATATDAEVIQFLADEALISQEFPVETQEVEQEIMTIQSTNKISRDALVGALKGEGYSFSDYRELIKNSLSKRNLIDREIRTKASVSEDDIKNYYYNNSSSAEENKTSQLFHIQIITIQPASRGNSTSATQRAAAEAIQALNRGEAFNSVAQNFSDHPSQSNGGDLGYMPFDQLSSVFKNEIKKIRIGAHSGLIGDAKSGFMILKLKDIKSGSERRFNEKKEEINQKLLAQEYKSQIRLWLERKRADAFMSFVN